jgi:hypothetical protein
MESVRIEPLHSQMNSHFGSWSFNGLPKLQRAIARVKPYWIKRFLYIIGKLLEHRCLKWAHMTHLNIWNTSYGQQKGRESNWQFNSRPLKVKNRPKFLACRWHATYHWKALDKGYNFALNFISVGGLHTKLWPHKVTGVPCLKMTKWHLGVGPHGHA